MLFYLLSLTTLTSEYSNIDVIVNMLPKIIDPIPIIEIFVIILPPIANSCTVQTIKNNPIAKNKIPGIP